MQNNAHTKQGQHRGSHKHYKGSTGDLTDVHYKGSTGDLTDVHYKGSTGDLTDVHYKGSTGDLTDVHYKGSTGDLTDVHYKGSTGDLTDIRTFITISVSLVGFPSCRSDSRRTCIKDLIRRRAERCGVVVS